MGYKKTHLSIKGRGNAAATKNMHTYVFIHRIGELTVVVQHEPPTLPALQQSHNIMKVHSKIQYCSKLAPQSGITVILKMYPAESKGILRSLIMQNSFTKGN